MVFFPIVFLYFFQLYFFLHDVIILALLKSAMRFFFLFQLRSRDLHPISGRGRGQDGSKTMPRAFWFAILVTIGQASAMATPSCTMEYFGEPTKGNWTFLPEPRTSQSCFDACSQKLDTWGPLDWYMSHGLQYSPPFGRTTVDQESWLCHGPQTAPNQAKPRGLMGALWIVANNPGHDCGCEVSWCSFEEGEKCKFQNHCGCWCNWEMEGAWYLASEHGGEGAEGPGSVLMGGSETVCDMMLAAKRRAVYLNTSGSCDPSRCRTPHGNGGFKCWGEWTEGTTQQFTCADGYQVVLTDEYAFYNHPVKNTNIPEKRYTCCKPEVMHEHGTIGPSTDDLII